MKCVVLLYSILVIMLSACGSLQTSPAATQWSTNSHNTVISDAVVPESTLEFETFAAIPSFTPLTSPCSTPAPNELNEFINKSITIEDNGKTYVSHVTSRFWIYLDDRIYPLQDLLNSIPEGLIGYISNGSIRGPQCYPIMFEAIREGKGIIIIKDFQLSIIIDNNLQMSPLPLH